MLTANITEEYLRAMRMGQKEKKELEALGKDPGPFVLDELFPETARLSAVELPVQEIPADRIIGVRSRGRVSAFSASFLPLPEAGSEFASKWMKLFSAQTEETGINEPIECYEYLGNFYVQEGNKRVSVLKYLGAVSIPARVIRLLPANRTEPRNAAYYEFVDFHRATGVYDIQFKKPGDYQRLLSAVGKKTGEEWTKAERQRLVSAYRMFYEAFRSLGGEKRELMPEDAFLLFLKVYDYPRLLEMTPAELKKALTALWEDVKASSEPESITVKTAPAEEEKKSVIQKLISSAPKHLSVAFICQRTAEESTWTRGHAEGAKHLTEAFPDSVTVKCYFNADSQEKAEELLDEAAADGAELVFTTTPPLLSPTLKAAVKYPKIRFYNCSACQPLSSVRSYYCRTYEGKFITGAIAGALAENGLVGYVGSYPILGVPASINAFALGARMTNPRARVLLDWSCLGGDCVKRLRERGARVISNRDIPLPDANYMAGGSFGTFITDGDGVLRPIASPCWMWGRLYENIVKSILTGSPEKKEQAVNYWWGMDSGVIDVTLTELVPEGVRALAEMLMDGLRNGRLDVFRQRLAAQDGTLISDGVNALSSLEILKMDRLSEAVEGRIPGFDELLPVSRTLVRELGVYRESIPPEEKTDR